MYVEIVDEHSCDANDMETITGINIIDTILANRGIVSKKDKNMALYADISMVHDPHLLKDGEKAAKKIASHVKAGSLIAFYSDYDADGFGALVTGVKLLQKLGANVVYYTNSREIGYGANKRGVEELLSKYPDIKLVITADNGIVAFEAVDILNSKGIDVVITDHHKPLKTGELPNAAAVVNPQRLDDTYPFKGLCGAGVVWKIMMLVYYYMGKPVSDTYELLDIVAFSTVGDVVPLLDENRIIVKHGLKMINNDCRPEWPLLKRVNSAFNITIGEIDSRTLAFTFVPQVNACSRLLGSIEDPIEIFLNPDPKVKEEKANYIKSVNDERKVLTNDQTERANTLCQDMDGCPVVLINSSLFTDGLVGIIAGRLKETFWAPAIVLTEDAIEPGILKGSGRSIEGFPMKDILDEIQEESGLLEKYGGHDMACGLSIKRENIEEFRRALCLKAIDRLTPRDYNKKVFVDVDIYDDSSIALILDALKELEPYGQGFPEPIARIKNFTPKEIKRKGVDGQHILLEGENITVIAWNGAEEWEENGSPQCVTAYGRLSVSSFDGKYQLVCEPSLIVPN